MATTQTMPSLLDAVRLAENEERLAVLTDEQLVDLIRTLERIERALDELRQEFLAAYERERDRIRSLFRPGSIPLGLHTDDDRPPSPAELTSTQARIAAARLQVINVIQERITVRAQAQMWAAAELLETLLIDTMHTMESEEDGQT